MGLLLGLKNKLLYILNPVDSYSSTVPLENDVVLVRSIQLSSVDKQATDGFKQASGRNNQIPTGFSSSGGGFTCHQRINVSDLGLQLYEILIDVGGEEARFIDVRNGEREDNRDDSLCDENSQFEFAGDENFDFGNDGMEDMEHEDDEENTPVKMMTGKPLENNVASDDSTEKIWKKNNVAGDDSPAQIREEKLIDGVEKKFAGDDSPAPNKSDGKSSSYPAIGFFEASTGVREGVIEVGTLPNTSSSAGPQMLITTDGMPTCGSPIIRLEH
ncbi:hypothetical protein LXL04_007008 [Taraxacum kok-saghyz]